MLGEWRALNYTRTSPRRAGNAVVAWRKAEGEAREKGRWTRKIDVHRASRPWKPAWRVVFYFARWKQRCVHDETWANPVHGGTNCLRIGR